MAKFHEVLKFLRSSRNITQAELAKAIGVSASTIGMYESGVREPNFETEEKIADYFNVSLDMLRGKEEQEETLPSGAFHGGLNIRADLWLEFSRLSDRNQEQAMTYIKYLAELQKKEEEHNDEQS